MGIVYTIPEAGLSQVLYGDKSSMMANYLQKQMSAMQNFVSPATSRIYDALQTSYNYVTDSLVKAGIMGQLRNSGIQVTDDYFQLLLTPEALRQASGVMQRWIMAQPDVRQLYLQQDIDGYSDTYKNVFGKEVGPKDYNYRRVMTGIVQDTDEYSHYVTYVDELMPGDRELSFDEKAIILGTWDYMKHIIQTSKVDFTHQTNPDAKVNR